jgi:hypothetical protein
VFRHTDAVRGAIVAVVPLLLLTACAEAPPDPTGPGRVSFAEPQDRREDLRRFYDQQLSWGACDDYVRSGVDEQVFALDGRTECARLEVPLDYDAPDGDTASVAVLRVPATGERIGSLVTNPGGPGGPGLAQGAVTGFAWRDTPMTSRFGATEPRVECFSDAEFDAGQAITTLLGQAGARDACEAWPAEPTLDYPYAQDIADDLAETLTISITGDPASPYDAGVSLAERPHGSLLTVDGERHTIAMSGQSECVNRVVADYLVDLVTPPADARCPA